MGLSAGTAPDKMRHALIVAGPTCSGKSALALGLAQRLGGTVINADAMQIYRELRVLSARPSDADEALAPHRLYGVRPITEPGNAAWWRDAALAEMDASPGLPILCGGTGLYFTALTDGLSAIPAPSDSARDEARSLLVELGAQGLHARLAEQDAETAARLRPSDGQRIARAYEVWRSTGRSLADWQRDTTEPAPWRFTAILLDPPRELLRAAIATRFDLMLEYGALAEVEALQHTDPALPGMRAHGVAELAAYLRGEITLAEARHLAQRATGQYTKRQATWFRHRTLAAQARTHIIHARIAGLEQFSESEIAHLVNFIQSEG
jgi:tRNA dimethylallyltransferase